MDDEQRRQLGARIRERRAAKDWSQARLAQEAGVDEDTIGSAERGNRRTQDDTLRRILDALDLPPTATARLIIDDLPDDLDAFVRVVVERLRLMTPEKRGIVLADLYPRLLSHGD